VSYCVSSQRPSRYPYLAYARWGAGHGEPLLEEAKMLAWLQAHGATLRPGTLTQTTLVVGVRMVM
jgi:hypothetical protein